MTVLQPLLEFHDCHGAPLVTAAAASSINVGAKSIFAADFEQLLFLTDWRAAPPYILVQGEETCSHPTPPALPCVRETYEKTLG